MKTSYRERQLFKTITLSSCYMFELMKQHQRNTCAQKYKMQNVICLQHRTNYISNTVLHLIFAMQAGCSVSTCFKHGFDEGIVSHSVKLRAFFKTPADNTLSLLMFS